MTASNNEASWIFQALFFSCTYPWVYLAFNILYVRQSTATQILCDVENMSNVETCMCPRIRANIWRALLKYGDNPAPRTRNLPVNRSRQYLLVSMAQ